MTQTEALRLALEALEKLWNIIDDIDTYSDMAKADEKLYRSLVERRQRQRFEETGISTDGYELHGEAITAIKAALEAKDEPFEYWNAVEGWVKIDEVRDHFDSVGCGTIYKTSGEDRVPLYTTPPQRKPLTDEEIERLWPMRTTDDVINFARAIEAAHGIKGEV